MRSPDNDKWWCWNKDSVPEGYLQVDFRDPRGVNLVHRGPDGSVWCLYVSVESRSDGKYGWVGTYKCPPSPGDPGTGTVWVEVNPSPQTVQLPSPPPPPKPDPDGGKARIIPSGTLTVRIEGFRVSQGPPGPVLRCEFTEVFTNTGAEAVFVEGAQVSQRIPARPGAEFNRDYQFKIGLLVKPGETVTKPADMGFNSSAEGIRVLVQRGGMRWENIRYKAAAYQAGGWERGVTTAFSRIDCPGGVGR